MINNRRTFIRLVTGPLISCTFCSGILFVGVLFIGMMLSRASAAERPLNLPFEYQFQHLTRDHGLSQGTAYAINQDPTGFMWFGTQEGLNRFDGRRMEVYYRANEPYSLVDSYIYSIKNDPQNPNLMWLGTHAGLQSYNHSSDQFQLFNGQPIAPLSDKQVYFTLFEDEQFMWLATDAGINYFDYQHNTNQPIILAFEGINQQRLNGVYSLLKLDHKHLLLATRAGLFKFHQRDKKIVKAYSIEGDPFIWQLYQDKQSNIWIGTTKGLYRLDSHDEVKRIELAEHQLDVTDQNIYSFLQATNGDLWIGSGNGLYLKSAGTHEFRLLKNNPNNKNSLINNTVWSIFQDRSGIIWFGTDNGISRFNPASLDFHTFSKRDDGQGLPDSWVMNIYQHQDQPLWVSTNAGVSGFNSEGKKQYSFDVSTGLSNAWVYSLIQQPTNDLWVGTFEGLNRINLASGQVDNAPFDGYFKNRLVWQLLADESAMWVATDKGLEYIDLNSDNIRGYQKGNAEEAGLTDERIFVLHKDRQNILWIGTSHGLNRLSNWHDPKQQKMVQYPANEGKNGSLTHNWVTDIKSDSHNQIWVSTDGGLSLMTEDQQSFIPIKSFKQTQEFIYAIEIDEHDNIWFSTNSGLGRLSYAGDHNQPIDIENLKLKFYTKNDGLQANEFNEFANWKDEEGLLYFGGVNGLNIIDPKTFMDRYEQIPYGVISRLDINGKTVNPGWKNKASPIENTINWTRELNLQFDQNYLTFYFSALDFSDPFNNQFQYRLIGLDDEWKPTIDNQPFVSFHKLSPGEYQLELRVATKRSDWQVAEQKIKINIAPPLWRTWQAITFYVLLIVGLLVGYLISHNKHVKRLKKLVDQEKKISRQFKEVDQIKDQFLANTSHELRTPLNGIIGLSDYLLNQNWDDIPRAEVLETLTFIQQSGIRMNEIVEDILQSSVLRSGNVSMHFQPIMLHIIVDQCLNEASHSKHKKNLTLSNNVATTLSRVNADPGRLKQILINLIGNGMKFTEKGEVRVSAVEGDEEIKVTVTDSGIGIDAKYHQSIFESFVQVDAAANRKYEGSGLGLSIVKQLVELHGGKVSIESSPFQGTSISFTLNKAVD